MNQQFKTIIEKSNAGIFSRRKITTEVLNSTFSLEDLIVLATDLTYKNHHKAVWIIELIAENHTNELFNHVEILVQKASQYKQQSAIRGMSRILFFITTSSALKIDSLQKNKILETCLDWFIGTEKIACKVYALKTLMQFCAEFPWLKSTLLEIIEKEYPNQSPGYQAASREAISYFKRL